MRYNVINSEYDFLVSLIYLKLKQYNFFNVFFSLDNDKQIILLKHFSAWIFGFAIAYKDIEVNDNKNKINLFSLWIFLLNKTITINLNEISKYLFLINELEFIDIDNKYSNSVLAGKICAENLLFIEYNDDYKLKNNIIEILNNENIYLENIGEI